MATVQATYLLPLKASTAEHAAELAAYLNALPATDVIVSDSSCEAVYRNFDRLLAPEIRHLRSPAAPGGTNGKVRNVLFALPHARCERVVVADDDVRYTAQSLRAVVDALADAEVVRPQNYFTGMPWHALLDTGRTLLNRALDGDWPGTLAFRRAALPHGYNAGVLFENYELVRTIRARGGRERVARGIYVARKPPSTAHFISQRVRQAYDEFARPARMLASLAIAPLVAVCAVEGRWTPLAAAVVVVLAAATFGWARDGGHRIFPAGAIALAPLWVCERAVCSWFALYQRLRFGGVRYAGAVLRHAATPRKELRRWTA